jgi:uncharacterized protein (TIGR03000 family)
MTKRFWLAALAGGLVLLMAAEAAQAQISFSFGRYGGRSGWAIDTPYFSYGRGPYYGWGYGSPYYGWGYGGPYYGGWGWGPYDYGYYRPRSGFSISIGGSRYYGSPYYYDYGYGYGSPYYGMSYYPSTRYYSSGYFPSYYSGGYSSGGPYDYTGATGYYGGYAMDDRTGGYRSFYSPASTGHGMADNQALIRVMVPDPNATVWFQGSETEQRGTLRTFVSPELESGKNYWYTVRASWTENGQKVTRTKQVQVHPGQVTTVNFMERDTDAGTGARERIENGTNPEPGVRPENRRPDADPDRPLPPE